MGYDELMELTIFSLNTKCFNQLRLDYLVAISVIYYVCKSTGFLSNICLKLKVCCPTFRVMLFLGCMYLSGVHLEGELFCDISHNVIMLYTNSNRLCAIRLKYGNHSIIIVCVYFPSDTGGRFNQIDVEQVRVTGYFETNALNDTKMTLNITRS